MKYIMSLALYRVLVAQWYSIEALRIFSLSHTFDKTKKNIFLYFFTKLKPFHLSYSKLQEYLCYRQHIYFKEYIEYFVTCPNSNKVKNDFFNQSNTGITVDRKS